jgi:hypothetical protein
VLVNTGVVPVVAIVVAVVDVDDDAAVDVPELLESLQAATPKSAAHSVNLAIVSIKFKAIS